MELTAQNKILTNYGKFLFHVYKDNQNQEHLVLIRGNIRKGQDIICRIHSACLIGEIFHSSSCHCKEELNQAMKLCQTEGKGVIVWLNHDTITNSIKNFNLIVKRKMKRNFIQAIEILKKFKIKSIKLITNNAEKVNQLKHYGINVSGIIKPYLGGADFPLITKEGARGRLKILLK